MSNHRLEQRPLDDEVGRGHPTSIVALGHLVDQRIGRVACGCLGGHDACEIKI